MAEAEATDEAMDEACNTAAMVRKSGQQSQMITYIIPSVMHLN